MSEVIDRLRLEVERHDGNRAAAGRRCGISRTAVSLLLDGKYPTSTARVERKIMNALSRHQCPWSGKWMLDAECESLAAAVPTSSPAAIAQWRSCQTCLLRKPVKEKKE